MRTVVFLGSKPIGATCLDILLRHSVDLDCKVIAVSTISRPEFKEIDTVASIAEDAGIPIIHNPDLLPECDFICSVQYHRILTAEQIAKARLLAFNLHLAPLPEYRGCNQFSFAIMNEETEFGVSIHRIDERIDHGDLYFEKRFPIGREIWVNELYQQTVEAGVQLFEQSLPHLIHHPESLSPIDISGRKEALYFRHQIQQLKQIPDDASIAQLKKIVRATAMPGFEPPYLMIQGTKVYCSPWIEY